jgi:hypothetical protein
MYKNDGAIQLRFPGAEWAAVPGVHLEKVVFRLVVAQDHVFVSDSDQVWMEWPASDPLVKGHIDALMSNFRDWEGHHDGDRRGR